MNARDRVRRALIVALLAADAAACAGRDVHIRGELDWQHWVVTNCEPRESYRVMFASTQVANFHELQRQTGITESEPAIFEFDGVTLGPQMPCNAHETVGIRAGSMQLARGTCQDAGTR